MKKIILVFPLVALLAAGCGKSATTTPTGQNNNGQSQQPLQSSQQAPANNFKTISVPAPATLYTAVKDGFTVNYPGVPTIKNSSLPAPGIGQISVTEYRQIFSNDKEYAYFNVGVYHYPANYQFPDGYLNSAFKLFYTIVSLEFPDATIAGQQPSQFLSNNAMSGLITIPTKLADGSTVNKAVYLLITVKGENTYIISAYGMEQSNYNAFLNSFKFTH